MPGTLPLLLAALAATAHAWPAQLARREVTSDASAISGRAFDYVVVGCGTAGLTVASRLAQNSSDLSVLCLEAGPGDETGFEDRINAPAMAYYNGIAFNGSQFDWGFYTTAQSGLADRPVFWPRGKLLGGSSAVNGGYLTRGAKLEYDAWQSLQTDGLEDWSWEGTYPYMKKAEHFSAPPAATARAAGIEYDEANHGMDGPIHMSYQGYLFQQQTQWIDTFGNLNISQNPDAYGGSTHGARFSLLAIDPSNYTRSYAKSGYLVDRPNLTILTGQTATRIQWDTSASPVRATGIAFAADASAQEYSVQANREVILTGGVIGSPHLLQVSGIGASSLLSSIGADVVVDLPGVGEHLNDHLAGGVAFETSANVTGDLIKSSETYAARQLALWKQGSARSLYTSPNNAIAYVTMNEVLGQSNAASMLSDLAAQKDARQAAVEADATVQAGFGALWDVEVETLMPGEVGAIELLMANTGRGDGSTMAITIQAAIQRPLSRGSLKSTSSSIFDRPSIDPGYLKEWADVTMLREAYKYARQVGNTAPLSDIMLTEIAPGPSVQTDEEWETYIRSSSSTEYHPAGSCSMLPRELGGCVDTQLKVYGTANVRVIDSSVIAISLAAHLNEPVYMIGEKGASIILDARAAPANTSQATPSDSGNRSAQSSSASALSTHSLLVLLVAAIPFLAL